MTDFDPFFDSIELGGDAHISLRGLSVLATDTSQVMIASLPWLQCYATDGDRMESAIPALHLVASDQANIMVAELPALGCTATSGIVAPDLALMLGELPMLQCAAQGYATLFDNVALVLPPLSILATDTTQVMVASLPSLRMAASDVEPTIDTSLILMMTPGYFVATVGHFVMSLDAEANVSMLSQLQMTIGFIERLLATDTLRMSDWHTHISITERPVVLSAFSTILNIVLQEQGSLDDTVDSTRHALSVLSDILLASSTCELPYQAHMAIAATAVLIGGFTATEYLQMTDEVLGSLLVQSEVQRIAQLLATAEVTMEVDGRLSVVLVAKDEVVAADQLALSLAGGMDITEFLFVGGRLTFDGIPYTVYSMVPQGTAMNEIEGWDYDSFFMLNGKAYATSPRGVVALEGPTDEGKDIDAKLRIGLSNFGSSLDKSIPNAYIGYTSDGVLALGAVTTLRGQKKINWYKLNPISRPSTTGQRFNIAKGLHSGYWDFELRNIDGANFSLDFIKVWTLELSRRKPS